MKVLLLNPPSPENYIRTGRWTRKSRANQSWPPIFLGYATGLLEREGHECKLLDAGSERIEGLQTWAIVEKYKPDLIAYYYGYDTLEQDLGFADILAKKFRTVLVGPWGYCVPDVLDYVENIDVVTVGEFDHTLLDIANGLANEDILGIKYHNYDEIIVNDNRPLCSSKELDKIPFVTDVYRRHLNMNTYRQTSIRNPFVDTLSARSCPHGCTFCLWIRAFQRMEPGRYRPRSIKNIIEEFWFIKNQMPEIKQIWLQDDTLPNGRARKLAQAIIDEDLNLCWGGYSRAEQSLEALSLMKDSGLRTLHVGYETSDPETLELIKKNITVNQMEKFASYVHELNLWTCAGFMIFPWQSKKQVRATIQWAKHKIRPRRFSFTQLFPYPNTPICNTIKDFKEKGHPLLTPIEMTELEKEGFKEIYLKNLPWMLDTLRFPREWKNVLGDATALIRFLFSGDN